MRPSQSGAIRLRALVFLGGAIALAILGFALNRSRPGRTRETAVTPGQGAASLAVAPDPAFSPDSPAALAALGLMNQWKAAHPVFRLRLATETRQRGGRDPIAREKAEVFQLQQAGSPVWRVAQSLASPPVQLVVEQRGAQTVAWFPATQTLVEITEVRPLLDRLGVLDDRVTTEWMSKLAAHGAVTADGTGGELRLRVNPAQLGIGKLDAEIDLRLRYDTDGQVTRVRQTYGGVEQETSLTYVSFQEAEIKAQMPLIPVNERLVRGKTFTQALMEAADRANRTVKEI